MGVEVIEFYEVYDAYDAEGKGPITVIARIKDHDEAKRYSRGRGNYNHDARVRHMKYVIADTADDVKNYERELNRQLALDKLTPYEKELLGLE
jgi:hypothetical protein